MHCNKRSLTHESRFYCRKKNSEKKTRNKQKADDVGDAIAVV
jgi:hypothetical protein